MNSAIILLLILASLFYNFWGFWAGASTRGQRVTIILVFGLAAFVAIFTIIRMGIVFKDGFGQSDLITNWSMGILLGIVIGTILFSVVFLLEDIIRLISLGVQRIQGNNIDLASRRRFVKNAALTLGSIPLGATLFGMIKGKYDFKVRLRKLAFTDLPKSFDGFRIVQFSDLHSGSYDSDEAMKRAASIIQEQKPDLILFTGDWINAKSSEIVPYKAIFKNLHATYGKFAVLGNHDYGDGKAWRDLENHTEIVEAMKGHVADMEFHALNNSNKTIRIGDESIRIVGVENWGRRPFPQKGDLDKALTGVEKDEFTVLLSHDPTHWEKKTLEHEKHIHLTLSGHTHGAQFGIDTSWMKWSPVQYAYKRWGGLYEEDGQLLYVNRGLGFIGFAGRIGIPPEITVLELYQSDS